MDRLRSVLEAALGEVYDLEAEAPGVYYCTAREADKAVYTECYLVEAESEVISVPAKNYGVPLRNCQELLSYDLNEPDSGYQIIQYELAMYRHRCAPTPELLRELRSAAVFGAQEYPEYFGEQPAPMDTPRGRTLRSAQIWNGVWCLETDQGEHMLAFSYPIWTAELSWMAQGLGEQTAQDQAEGIDNTFGYLFFPAEEDGIPLQEWIDNDFSRADAVQIVPSEMFQ